MPRDKQSQPLNVSPSQPVPVAENVKEPEVLGTDHRIRTAYWGSDGVKMLVEGNQENRDRSWAVRVRTDRILHIPTANDYEIM
jgi:hypothetical protein